VKYLDYGLLDCLRDVAPAGFSRKEKLENLECLVYVSSLACSFVVYCDVSCMHGGTCGERTDVWRADGW
jgi:hypothetical protein